MFGRRLLCVRCVQGVCEVCLQVFKSVEECAELSKVVQDCSRLFLLAQDCLSMLQKWFASNVYLGCYRLLIFSGCEGW